MRERDDAFGEHKGEDLSPGKAKPAVELGGALGQQLKPVLEALQEEIMQRTRAEIDALSGEVREDMLKVIRNSQRKDKIQLEELNKWVSTQIREIGISVGEIDGQARTLKTAFHQDR